jgi:hypothetical protein
MSIPAEIPLDDSTWLQAAVHEGRVSRYVAKLVAAKRRQPNDRLDVWGTAAQPPKPRRSSRPPRRRPDPGHHLDRGFEKLAYTAGVRLQTGVPLHVAQRRLGHRSIAITLGVYATRASGDGATRRGDAGGAAAWRRLTNG